MKSKVSPKTVTVELSREELEKIIQPIVSVIDSDTGKTCDTPADAIRAWRLARPTYAARLAAHSKQLGFGTTKAQHMADVRGHDQDIRLLKKLASLQKAFD